MTITTNNITNITINNDYYKILSNEIELLLLSIMTITTNNDYYYY